MSSTRLMPSSIIPDRIGLPLSYTKTMEGLGFDPLVARWFTARFGKPTEPQLRGWPEIRAGRDVLISAPTGSGKTLAAFLICLDGLVRAARAGALARRNRSRLRLAAQGAQQRRPQEPRSAAGGDRRAGAQRGVPLRRSAPRCAPATRPPGERQQMAPPPAAHPGHHARVALHPAHRREARRDAAHRAHRDRGRNPRRGRRQARLAPGALARAARRPGRRSAAAPSRSASASPPP